jgi:hypothetical protein
MKVYYVKKVHTRPFRALLKKLRPRGRVARCKRGGRLVVSNSNPVLIENPGLAFPSSRVGSESAGLWKLYTITLELTGIAFLFSCSFRGRFFYRNTVWKSLSEDTYRSDLLTHMPKRSISVLD